MSDALALPKIKPPPVLQEKKRRARSETETLAIIFMQLTAQGLIMRCGCGCGRPVEFGNHRGEHHTARKLAAPGENPDRPENQSYWCKDPCSLAKDKKDIRDIAKSKRIRKETKGSLAPKAKIQSRGFQATPITIQRRCLDCTHVIEKGQLCGPCRKARNTRKRERAKQLRKAS